MQIDPKLMDSSVWKYAVNNIGTRKKAKGMDEFRETTLKGHVEKCQLRYEILEQKLENLNARLTKVETDLGAIKSTMHTGFSEIKLLLEKQSNARFIQIIATAGTVLTAVIAGLFVVLR